MNRAPPVSVRADFFSNYLEFVGHTEVPIFFHRWAAIASIGAYLGKSCWFKFGHAAIYPNIYCMLIGNAGSRKSTAIKLAKKVMLTAGYTTIAASKTTKEKFLLDLSGIDAAETPGKTAEDILNANIFGATNDEPAESFIMADEFNDFFGNNNLEFISLLGSLWDWEGPYENRIKNAKSFIINNPTISILGGNTPTGFSIAFPPEILGQGFFSRLLLVYAEPTGMKIPFPVEVSEEQMALVAKHLQLIKMKTMGRLELTPAAKVLLERIYNTYRPIPDVRFESYSNRRFTHLIKLCIIHAAANLEASISESSVIYANTILTHTEHLMPKALGEFGKSKHSDISHKIIQMLDTTDHPLTLKDIWKNVHNDLEKMNELSDLLRNLAVADKIQMVTGGFLAKKTPAVEAVDGLVDYSLLTNEERGMNR